jgi:CBS domain-containing protein
MAHLLVVILYKPSQLPELLEVWHDIDVPGVTVMESAGGYRTRNWLQQMGLGAISGLFGNEEVRSKTLLTVIEDDDMLEKAIIEAERVIGDFNQPDRGLLFVVPVSRAEGVFRPGIGQKAAQKTQYMEAMTDRELVTRDTPVSVVNQILNLEPVIVQVDQSLIEVAEAMIKARHTIHVACVVNEQQRLVGLISLRSLTDDLFMQVVPEDFLSEARDLENALHFADLGRTHTAGEAMMPAVWVNEEDTIRDGFHKMHENQLSGIPILNDRYEVIGYIDLLELLAIYVQGQNTSKRPADSSAATQALPQD